MTAVLASRLDFTEESRGVTVSDGVSALIRCTYLFPELRIGAPNTTAGSVYCWSLALLTAYTVPDLVSYDETDEWRRLALCALDRSLPLVLLLVLPPLRGSLISDRWLAHVALTDMADDAGTLLDDDRLWRTVGETLGVPGSASLGDARERRCTPADDEN